MQNILIREPRLADEDKFISAMLSSQDIHKSWTMPPLTHAQFLNFIHRAKQDNAKSYLAMDENQNIIGVFNISEIVRGHFQSAYLGFYGVVAFSQKGLMSHALKSILKKVFTELGLHRLEANIQPENIRSINLVSHNGFKKEGFSPRYLNINGEWCDHERWAITVEDYHTVQALNTLDGFDIIMLHPSDLDEIVFEFKNIGWHKPKTIYEKYLEEQDSQLRTVFVAKLRDKFCGYVTIKWQSSYPAFLQMGIPEISDLNVLPFYQNKGIGAKLIKSCESFVRERGHHEIGIGVGLTADYGQAQRLYVRLGYVPDGQGVYHNNRAARLGDVVSVDDDLVLYMKKSL